jgi:hypothetical protein
MQSSALILSARAQMVISSVLAVLVIATLSPVADAMVPAFPLATSEVRWRFQVFGTLLAALPQLALLLATIVGVGILAGHRVDSWRLGRRVGARDGGDHRSFFARTTSRCVGCAIDRKPLR